MGIRYPLAKCQLNEFWQGELDLESQSLDTHVIELTSTYQAFCEPDLELQSLDTLWQQLQQVDELLEKVAKQDEQVQLSGQVPHPFVHSENSACSSAEFQ